MPYHPPHHLHSHPGTLKAINLSLEVNVAVQFLGFKYLNIKKAYLKYEKGMIHEIRKQ